MTGAGRDYGGLSLPAWQVVVCDPLVNLEAGSGCRVGFQKTQTWTAAASDRPFYIYIHINNIYT